MKLNPKLKHMTEEELESWELKLKELEFENSKKDMVNKLKQGREWLY